mmetsp:Transcript_3508/g.4837  ORF Transcript_3508/g.4837 Transcript_3508/m.4837 type:complete len:201 (+) Transcript_3508:187-789(+)
MSQSMGSTSSTVDLSSESTEFSKSIQNFLSTPREPLSLSIMTSASFGLSLGLLVCNASFFGFSTAISPSSSSSFSEGSLEFFNEGGSTIGIGVVCDLEIGLLLVGGTGCTGGGKLAGVGSPVGGGGSPPGGGRSTGGNPTGGGRSNGGSSEGGGNGKSSGIGSPPGGGGRLPKSAGGGGRSEGGGTSGAWDGGGGRLAGL